MCMITAAAGLCDSVTLAVLVSVVWAAAAAAAGNHVKVHDL